MSDKAKYERMASIIDGPLTQTNMEFKTSPDDFNDLRRRLSAMLIAVNKLGNVPSAVCLLCSVIQNKKICHKSGCPSCFNHCFKCLGRHSSQSCSNKYFNVARRFCFKCWMPLFDIFGFSFHSKEICDLRNCTSACRNFLKPLAACFFYRRQILQLPCPCTDLVQYQSWLFSPTSASVSGSGQVPGILLLLEASFAQMTNDFE